MKKNVICFFVFSMFLFSMNAQSKFISGPIGSGVFGEYIYVLKNGNYVVVDQGYDLGAIPDVGAVYLFNGSNHNLISKLTGSKAGDAIGSDSILVLPSGNFVVRSSKWDNGSNTNAGAITWCNGTTGLNGVVSISNSLIGSTSNDAVGYWRLYILTNGNYVCTNHFWDNGTIVDAGAVTWCSGVNGLSGVISSSNSIVGSTSYDYIGNQRISILNNGNYVIPSSFWDRGIEVDAGAVTWCNGATGKVGTISSLNSYVGNISNDKIGFGGVFALLNGNYVFSSPEWDNGALVNAGAVTWGNGQVGSSGYLYSINSIVGSQTNDYIGNNGLCILSNGNYIISGRYWDNGAIVDAGFARWCNGSIGSIGVVNASNSIVGASPNDNVGLYIQALTNGNYVVYSPNFDNGAIANVGAVTWANGSSGKIGTINVSNSLIGVTAEDKIGNFNGDLGFITLTNGNYVVKSNFWDNGAIVNAGAITWGNGATGTAGYVTALNSVVGTSSSTLGNYLTALPNGNYLIRSFNWYNGSIASAGAITWCSGTNVTTGTVSASNSLIGSSMLDRVGEKVLVLSNSNYIALTPNWDNGGNIDAGAATFCNGATGRVGLINSSNSLVGNNPNHEIGFDAVELSNGNYIVQSPDYSIGASASIGAATWCNGNSGRIGNVSVSNSLVGTYSDDKVGKYVYVFSNGTYCVNSTTYDFNSVGNSGAIATTKEGSPIIGSINACNSIFGNATNSFYYTSNILEDTVFNFLIIGIPRENKVFIVDYYYPRSVFPKTICANESFIWNGASLSTAGNYKDTLQTVLGCDSIVTLNLSITPTPIKTTTISGTSITADEASASYQWIDCNTSAPIAGATNQTFVASRNGSYKVAVTKSSCTEFSDCVNIVGASILSAKEANNMSIYPNPSNGSFTLTSAEDGIYNVLNEFGQVVNTFELNEQTKHTHKIQQLPAGIYFVKNLNTMSMGQKIVVLHGE